jgi:hypothetical protein
MARLPFLTNHDCALGVAIKSYLEQLLRREQNGDDVQNDDVKSSTKAMAKQAWFPQTIDLERDIASAFHLWDAVSHFA